MLKEATMVSAVIFHCDGVLVDSASITNRVIAEEVTRLGWAHTPMEVAKKYRGLREYSIITDVSGFLTSQGNQVSQWDGHSWWAGVEHQIYSAFRKELRPVAGVEAVLSLLSNKDIPLCVTTQFSVERAGVALTLTGLTRHFSIKKVFSTSMVGNPKPHPDLHLLAAKRLKIHPSECVAVEDSVSGTKAARSAGMKVLGYARTAEQANELECAGAYIFHSMGRLPRMLKVAA